MSSKANTTSLSEFEWLFDFIIAFLKSPPWTIPLNQFIDENCLIFDSDEENKFSYTECHNKFMELIDSLLTENLAEVGISEEQFIDACRLAADVNNNEDSSENEVNRLIFQQLLAVDDFLTFKKMMLKRNMELEFEAMRALEAGQLMSSGELKASASAPIASLSEADEYELAIRLSQESAEEQLRILEEAEKLRNLALENELEQALSASTILFAQMETARIRKEQLELEQAIALSLALEAERLKLLQGADENTTNKESNVNTNSSNNNVKHLHSASASPTPGGPTPPVSTSTTNNTSTTSATATKSTVSPSPSSTSTSKPSNSTPNESSSGVSGNKSKGSTLSALPGILPKPKIATDSLTSAHAELLDKVEKVMASSSTPQTAQPLPSDNIISSNENKNDGGLSPAELERRKTFLLEQKARIVAKKNEERKKELATYTSTRSAEKTEMEAVKAKAVEATGKDQGPNEMERKRELMRIALAQKLKEDMNETQRIRAEKELLNKVTLITNQLAEIEATRLKSDSEAIRSRIEELKAEKLRLEQLKKLHNTIGNGQPVNAADTKFKL